MENFNVKADRELTNLRYADDITIFAKNVPEVLNTIIVKVVY